MDKRIFPKNRFHVGSALILTIVLTSLLAIVGTVFLMVTRVNRRSTAFIEENRQLESAVEAVLNDITEELINDVPGVSGQEYYDYPGSKDKWLASNLPCRDTNNIDSNSLYWRQISDPTGYISGRWGAGAVSMVNVDPAPNSNSWNDIKEYPEILLDRNGNLLEQLADADGEGIGDSKWIEFGEFPSSYGKDVTAYVAIRVIDNSGMVNLNTAYSLDPTRSLAGGDQLQIRLNAVPTDTIGELTGYSRGWSEPATSSEISDYLKEYIWSIDDPCGVYKPFDISEELDLRYRYCVNSPAVTRLETIWGHTISSSDKLYDSSSGQGLSDWEPHVYHPNSVAAMTQRHLLTTCSMDRFINTSGKKMLNINTASVGSIQETVKKALLEADPHFGDFADVNSVSGQISVNTIDFRDDNDDVTTIDVNGVRYYGFERPCVYISEMSHSFVDPRIIGPATYIHKSFAIELHKPFYEDNDPCNTQWRIHIDNSAAGIGDVTRMVKWSGTRRFHVIAWEDPNMPFFQLQVDFDNSKDPNSIDSQILYGYDSNDYSSPVADIEMIPTGTVIFDEFSVINLQRYVDPDWVTVDTVPVPRAGLGSNWLRIDAGPQSIQRDITRHKCIRRLWDPNESTTTLGKENFYAVADSVYIQAHPENRLFKNTGDIGKIFREDVQRGNMISGVTETDVRIDLADPNYQQLLNHLTVLPPSYSADVNDTRVIGRINVNTAPVDVLARLPWVSYEQAWGIAAYRDKLNISAMGGPDYYHGGAPDSRELETGINDLRETAGFVSTGELAGITNLDAAGKVNSAKSLFSLHSYATDSLDLTNYPDLTASDEAVDDVEEQNVIFSRISDVVTVRSDVFTAYILVRIGAEGPQRRVMAILDRSGVRPDGAGGFTGNVKILALQPVADPR